LNHWVIPTLGQRYVSEISIDDVARLISKMTTEGLKRNSIKGYLRPLSRLMSNAVRSGLASSNPVKGLDKDEWPKADQRVMRILSSEEIERLLSPIPLKEEDNDRGGVPEIGSGSDARSAEEEGREVGAGDCADVPATKTPKPPLSEAWRPLISFLIFTGLRITEALNVRWEDIDLEAGTVTVGVSKTQAGTGRSVILIPALASTLRHHRLRSHYSASEDYVFPNAKGEIGDRNYILAKVLKPATKAAGVTEVTLHELRHTFASILVGMGFDVTFIANQLGHADPGITLRTYARLFNPEARKDEAREKLQIAFGGLL
jgi:integrase